MPRRAIRHRRWVRRHGEISIVDRQILVDVIIPSVRGEAAGSDVLFVGVEWYTAEYASRFPQGNLVTLDIDDALACHGGPRHVTGDVRQLTQHFAREQFAAVICNGVVGFGLDTKPDVERALSQIAECTRSGGLVVVGWNDTDELRVTGLELVAQRGGLLPASGAGQPSWRNGPHGPLRHTYDIYRKP